MQNVLHIDMQLALTQQNVLQIDMQVVLTLQYRSAPRSAHFANAVNRSICKYDVQCQVVQIYTHSKLFNVHY